MTLVIGGKGSIGRRYCSILSFLKKPFKILDIQDPKGERDLEKIDFDEAIIATPTDTHFEYCEKLIALNKVFLCEKPLSKNEDECMRISEYLKGYVVNNYEWAIRHIMAPWEITYDYYNTGKDGVLWDCCQLIYLDQKAKIQTKSPIYRLHVNGQPIQLTDIERSYIWMISAFLTDNRLGLWSLKTGLKMTQKVLERAG